VLAEIVGGAKSLRLDPPPHGQEPRPDRCGRRRRTPAIRRLFPTGSGVG